MHQGKQNLHAFCQRNSFGITLRDRKIKHQIFVYMYMVCTKRKFFFNENYYENLQVACYLALKERHKQGTIIIPVTVTVKLAEADEGLPLATVQVYTPAVVTVRVWVYCAVSGSFNTVSVLSVTVVESLVQVTLVAGPPVEIQVRVSWSESYIRSPDIIISPEHGEAELSFNVAYSRTKKPLLTYKFNKTLLPYSNGLHYLRSLAVYSPT